MAINISKIRESEAVKQAVAAEKARVERESKAKLNESKLCDLIQVMALHFAGYDLKTLMESAPAVFAEFQDHPMERVEKIKALCGFFSQQLYRMLGDGSSKVDIVWNSLHAVSFKDSVDSAMEIAYSTAYEVLRGGNTEVVGKSTKVTEEKVVVTEPASQVAYEDAFEDNPLKNNPVLKAKKLASERSKQGAKTRAAKKASMLSKEA